jgi:heme oxygenase (biliverdin-IX-beta and delta-forming)
MIQAIGSGLDIMALLKAGTSERHGALEKIMPFFRNDFSLEDYARVLKAFLGFFEPVERELAVISTWNLAGIDVCQRLRSDLLVADLLALGASNAEIALLPRCSDLPALTKLEEGFGCMYVLEGSTLGGQLISRQVQARFAVSEEAGLKFFNGYGSQTGVMWHDFCAGLRQHAEGSKNQGAILAAAGSTFELLETWMRKAGFSE